MIIYPDIEIHKGQCVTLKHGSIAQPQVFEIKPLDAAKKFEQGGAQWLHVVDLDGVFEYHGENSEIIKQIIADSNIPVQVGGGIRSSSSVDWWMDNGASRVVMGTAAVADQRLVEEVCVKYPEKVVVSIDARDGKVVSHGWKNISAFTAMELAKRFERSGVAAIIYTDIDRYDELPESSMANTTQMGTELSCPVISSGTVRNLDDISILSNLPNIFGVVVGWALFNEQVSIEEAVAVGSQKPTVAEFI
ncbi:HisA/HisF-related TIM barrel protein [Candidatus Spongiihabitans sp.]|uniref:1-(5-phosphoribosyl)-5-[(5- phosphoribosylamino)methylideneamino]imidazole-4- carboxamide isomerase n=1 Tax=Candidatus Spongiihabitans sp. TaxID=3101308 RepID=UPI003C6EE174